MTAVDNLLARLEHVKKAGGGWTARCPAHADAHASLSVGEGDDGRALVRCFAGCDAEEIVGAVGLSLAELFEPHENGNGVAPRKPPKPAPVFAEADVDRYRSALLGDEKALARLAELRGWTREACERLELGLDRGRVVFPVRDAAGLLVGVQRYAPNPARRRTEDEGRRRIGT